LPGQAHPVPSASRTDAAAGVNPAPFGRFGVVDGFRRIVERVIEGRREPWAWEGSFKEEGFQSEKCKLQTAIDKAVLESSLQADIVRKV